MRRIFKTISSEELQPQPAMVRTARICTGYLHHTAIINFRSVTTPLAAHPPQTVFRLHLPPLQMRSVSLELILGMLTPAVIILLPMSPIGQPTRPPQHKAQWWVSMSVSYLLPLRTIRYVISKYITPTRMSFFRI